MVQLAPAAPQASLLMPLKHEPVSSQQPSQLLALQRATGLVPHPGAARPKPKTAPNASAFHSEEEVDDSMMAIAPR